MKNKIERIKNYYVILKNYFKIEGHIVFWISFLFAMSIGLYKFWLVNNDFLYPLWEDADIAGEIMYSISTSVVAAGIFYFFTIYLPRYFKIRQMKIQIIDHINGLETMSRVIATDIVKKGISKEYTISYFSDDNILAELNFNNYIIHLNRSGADVHESMKTVFSFDNNLLKDIIYKYSGLLPIDVNEKLLTFCNVIYPEFEYKSIIIDNQMNFPYFKLFCNINGLIKLLKEL